MKSPLVCIFPLLLLTGLHASASIFSGNTNGFPAAVPASDPAVKALSSVSAGSKARQGELAGQAKALRKSLDALRAKARNQKGDIAEQLSKTDRDQFNLLGLELRYLENAILIEEVRQKHIEMATDIYQASYFVAAAASEYVADKGALDDDFEAFCEAKAKAEKIEMPVALLFNAENFIISEYPPKK